MYYERLEDLRLDRQLTKREVARYFNVSESTYGKWELGHRKPDIETIGRLAEFYGVSTDYLLSKTDDKGPPRKKKSPSEIQFSDVSYALFGEMKELTEEDKEELLRNARRMRELRQLREQANRHQA